MTRKTNCFEAFVLQDHAARSFPYQVSLSLLETPADQKAGKSQLSIIKSWIYINITPAWPKHALKIYFTFLACKFSDAMHVKKKVGLKFQREIHKTWCCIRTQSLFISAKFCSTNSTASMKVSPSLEGDQWSNTSEKCNNLQLNCNQYHAKIKTFNKLTWQKI